MRGLLIMGLLVRCLLINIASVTGQTIIDKTSRINSQEQMLSFLASDTTSLLSKADENTLTGKNYSHGYPFIASRVVLAKNAITGNKIDASDAYYEQAITLCQEREWGLVEGYLHYQLGKALYKHGKTASGVEHLLYARELITPASYTAIPGCGSFLAFMGAVYSDYKDYAVGLEYLNTSLQYPFQNTLDEYYAYGTLGLIYYKLNNADSSIWASSSALEISKKLNEDVYGQMAGNLGVGYLQKGDYDSALFYLAIDYRVSSSLHNWPSAGGSLLMQTKILLQQGKVASAEALLKRVDSIYSAYHCSVTLHSLYYYQYRVKANRLKGNYQQAVLLQDSADKYNQLYMSENQASSLHNLELTTAKKVSKARIALLESEKRSQVFSRNLVIALSIFGIIIFLQVLYRNTQKRKNEKQMYELKLKASDQQLKNYLDNIREKNRILEELTEELGRHKENGSSSLPGGEADWETLAKIKNSTLLTEQDWNEFVQLIDIVYPHFFVKLTHKMPDLTRSEIRLFTLIKLNLSNKEMSAMLGISVDSVLKAKQRVKKKMPFNGDQAMAIEDLINSI